MDEPLERLLEELEKGIKFARTGGQNITNVMIVSKVITLLAKTMVFNKVVR